MKTTRAILFSLLLFSCSEQSAHIELMPMQEIKGRDYEGKRFHVYRARIPAHWIRKDSFPEESLLDTKKSIGEFFIQDNGGIIRIAIHNFPTESIEQRIPPSAQVARWQRQFNRLVPEESSITPQAFSGYSGLKFKGCGQLNNEDQIMLGWSLQLDKEHYRALSPPIPASQENLYREMRADVTLKVTGPKELMEKYEEEINHFARSFELIEEIPFNP